MNSEIISCEICGSTNRRVLYRADTDTGLSATDFTVTKPFLKKGTVYKCADCGFLYSAAGLNPKCYYEDVVDEKYERDREERLKEFKIAFAPLRKYIKFPDEQVNLLDIGCLTGIFLEYVRETYGKKYKCRGIEPSKWATKICRDKGLEVKQGFFEDQAFEEEYFHAVTMFDCLEHVRKPKDVLLKVNNILRKGGLFLLTTPNIESLFHKIFKRRYWFVEIMHLYYFSPRTIKILLDKTGFELLVIKKHYKCLKIAYAIDRLIGMRARMAALFKGLIKIPALNSVDISFYAGQMLVIARKK